MSKNNPFKIIGGRNEYGGMVIQVLFEHKPDYEDLRKAALKEDPSLPFGFRVTGQKDNLVWIKIHND